jgi:hypothetical protein
MLQRIATTPTAATPAGAHYYRATSSGAASAAVETALARSIHHRDLLLMCQRGMWERELRQFMPPQTLRQSMDSLLALGLVERLESEPDAAVH